MLVPLEPESPPEPPLPEPSSWPEPPPEPPSSVVPARRRGIFLRLDVDGGVLGPLQYLEDTEETVLLLPLPTGPKWSLWPRPARPVSLQSCVLRSAPVWG